VGAGACTVVLEQPPTSAAPATATTTTTQLDGIVSLSSLAVIAIERSLRALVMAHANESSARRHHRYFTFPCSQSHE
jgi:hypothetical protein